MWLALLANKAIESKSTFPGEWMRTDLHFILVPYLAFQQARSIYACLRTSTVFLVA